MSDLCRSPFSVLAAQFVFKFGSRFAVRGSTFANRVEENDRRSHHGSNMNTNREP